jgi:hypothetical protein
MESENKKVKRNVQEGRWDRPPIRLFSMDYPKPMFPLTILLCYMCRKKNGNRDCFLTGSHASLSIEVCRKCLEFNRISQEAGIDALYRANQIRPEEEEEITPSHA